VIVRPEADPHHQSAGPQRSGGERAARDRTPRSYYPKVFVITGPSGVGKGTLIRTLVRRIPELELSVSATTRRPRLGETHGVDYHFLDDEEFARRVADGDFLEYADYSGRRYGTLRSDLEQRLARGVPVVLEIEVQGARQVAESMPEAERIFIAPPSEAALRERLTGRGTDSDEDVDKRLATARDELRAQGEFPHVVRNDRLEDAAAALEELVRAALASEAK
jgi:guanylate kinase